MIRMIKLIESLKHTPARAGKLFEVLNRSILRLHAIQSVMQQPDSPFLKTAGTEYQRLLSTVSSACETILNLQRLLEPLFGENSNMAHTWAKRT